VHNIVNATANNTTNRQQWQQQHVAAVVVAVVAVERTRRPGGCPQSDGKLLANSKSPTLPIY